MTPRPTTWRRRIQRPWISAVLLALLAADAWWVLHSSTYLDESHAAVLAMRAQDALFGADIERNLRYDFLRLNFPGDLSLIKRPVPGYYLIRDDEPAASDELRLVDEDTESWDELARLLQESPDRVASVDVAYGTRRTGFWALTREHTIDAVRVRPWEAGTFEDVTSDAVRSLVAPHVSHKIAAAGPADQSTTRILPLGYLHNTAALLTLAAFIISLGWIPRLPAAYRARRGRRRLARAQCPRCRYHLAGLEADQCPECGEQWGGGGGSDNKEEPERT